MHEGRLMITPTLNPFTPMDGRAPWSRHGGGGAPLDR